MGRGSGAGVIFGNSGGVMEAAIRTAYHFLTNESPKKELLKLNGFYAELYNSQFEKVN